MPNTRKMTLQAALVLHAGLPVLDGHVESTTVENLKTNEKTTTTKTIPYAFGVDGKGGKVRWNITRSADTLEAVQKTFTKARDALINQISKGTGVIKPDDAAAITELNRGVTDLLEGEIEIAGLLNIRLSDLRLDENPQLTPSALRPLMPLITDDTPAEAA